MTDNGLLAHHEITAIVPCHDEEECLAQAYEEITRALCAFGDYEILFVDDGSTDGTLALIKWLAESDPRVRYLSFTRNFGLEAAFSAGYRYATKPWTVLFDADLQSPPTELPKLFHAALQGYDAVFARREQRRDPLWRRWGSLAQHWVARRVFHIELPYRGSIFRVVRTAVAKKIVALDLGTPYFLATVALVGARYTSVATEHRPRLAGRGKWTTRMLFTHSMELFVGFSHRLLSLVYLSAAVSVAGAASVGVLIASGHPGRRVAMAAILAMSVFLAIDLAVMARYLVRIVKGQSRNPHLYLVRESNVDVDPRDSLYEYEPVALGAAR